MTLIEIVEQLQKQGNDVSYRHRKDGGIIITSINGKRFKGAEGNALARRIVGATLSEARKIQLQVIKPKKGESPASRRKKKLDKEILKLKNRVQRKWAKKVEKSKGKITLQKVRWNVENLGREEAIRKLREADRYASGLAYNKNIDALLDYIDQLRSKVDDLDSILLDQLSFAIDNNRKKIKEDQISYIYNELYEVNHGVPVREVVRRIKDLLNIDEDFYYED